jgi:hypothetical protein
MIDARKMSRIKATTRKVLAKVREYFAHSNNICHHVLRIFSPFKVSFSSERLVDNKPKRRRAHSCGTYIMKLKFSIAFEGAQSISDLGNNMHLVTLDGGDTVEFSLVCAALHGAERTVDGAERKAAPKELTANAMQAEKLRTIAVDHCKMFPGTSKEPVDLRSPESATPKLTPSPMHVGSDEDCESTDEDDLDELDDSFSSQPAGGFGPRINREMLHDVSGQGFTQETYNISASALTLDDEELDTKLETKLETPLHKKFAVFDFDDTP